MAQEREASGDDSLVLHNFIKQVCPPLIPVLLELLTKQEEDQECDESVWSLSMASGTCLCLVANCVANDVVPLVMPYVQVGWQPLSENALKKWMCCVVHTSRTATCTSI